MSGLSRQTNRGDGGHEARNSTQGAGENFRLEDPGGDDGSDQSSQSPPSQLLRSGRMKKGPGEGKGRMRQLGAVQGQADQREEGAADDLAAGQEQHQARQEDRQMGRKKRAKPSSSSPTNRSQPSTTGGGRSSRVMSEEPAGASRPPAGEPLPRRQSPTGAANNNDPARQPAGFGRLGDPVQGKGHRGASSNTPSRQRGTIDSRMKPSEVCEVIVKVMPTADIPGIFGHMLVTAPEQFARFLAAGQNPQQSEQESTGGVLRCRVRGGLSSSSEDEGDGEQQ